MGPTKVDPVDCARTIVRSCLVREYCKLDHADAKGASSPRFEAPLEQRARPRDGTAPQATGSLPPADVAALLFVILSWIAVIVWLVSTR